MSFNEISILKLLQYNRVLNFNGTVLDNCFEKFPKVLINRSPPFSLPVDVYH